MNRLLKVAVLIALLVSVVGCSQPAVAQTVPTSAPTTTATLAPTLPPPTVAPTPTATQAPTLVPDATSTPSAPNLFEAEAGFKIRLPTQLPDDYSFQEAIYISETQAVTVRYVWSDTRNTGEMLFITQQRQPPQGDIAEEAYVETLPIGAVSAILAQGNWFNDKWEKDAPVFRLRWNTPDFYFTILFVGNESTSAGFLTPANLIALAEQMQ